MCGHDADDASWFHTKARECPRTTAARRALHCPAPWCVGLAPANSDLLPQGSVCYWNGKSSEPHPSWAREQRSVCPSVLCLRLPCALRLLQSVQVPCLLLALVLVHIVGCLVSPGRETPMGQELRLCLLAGPLREGADFQLIPLLVMGMLTI